MIRSIKMRPWQQQQHCTMLERYIKIKIKPCTYLRRVPRTSILLGERAGGGRESASEVAEVSVSLIAGVKSPLPNMSLAADEGSLSDSFSTAGADDGGALLSSAVELGLERMVVGRGMRAESLFLAPVAAGVSPMGVWDRGVDDARRGAFQGAGTDEGRGALGRDGRDISGSRDTSVVCTTPCTTTSVPGGGN
jgi:hypothetical protein